MAARSRGGGLARVRQGFLVLWARGQPSHIVSHRTLRPRAGALSAGGVSRRVVCPRCGVIAEVRRSSPAKRFAQEGRALETVTPWLLERHADSDPRANHDLGRGYSRAQFERRELEREPVVVARDAECFAQASRSRTEQALVLD